MYKNTDKELRAIANSVRRMTDFEIQAAISAETQLSMDEYETKTRKKYQNWHQENLITSEDVIAEQQRKYESLLSKGELEEYRGQYVTLLYGHILSSADSHKDAKASAREVVGYHPFLVKWVPHKPEILTEKIDGLFMSSRHFWSVNGLAERLGEEEKVSIESILRTDERFRMSWLKTQDWRNLYALSDKPVKGRERFAQFIANIRGFRKPFEDLYAPEYS